MKLFDLHCDTAGECYNRKIPLKGNNLHIDLCKVKTLDRWCQVFAIWIPDELRGDDALDYFKRVLENHKKEIELNSDKIQLCQHFIDIEEAEKYDLDDNELVNRASGRAKESAKKLLLDSVEGYSTKTLKAYDEDVFVNESTYSYRSRK